MTQPVFETTAAALREKSKLRASAATPSCPAAVFIAVVPVLFFNYAGLEASRRSGAGGRIRADPGAQRRHHVDGFEDRWDDPAAYLNADAAGRLHYPGFGAEAAGG